MPKNNFLIHTNLYVPVDVDIVFLQKFGNNLKKLRKAKGLSQAQLAFEANIELSQISRIERGRINTKIATVNLLSKVLDVPISDFFIFSE